MIAFIDANALDDVDILFHPGVNPYTIDAL